MTVIKYTPSDFLVKEVYLPREPVSGRPEHAYFLLRKCGFTTFEAIEKVSKLASCDPRFISYAGLKDEDGVTEQYVGVEKKYCPHVPRVCGESDVGGSFINMDPTGETGPPIEIGKLVGNAFRVTVRRMDAVLFDTIKDNGKADFQFLNYYDTQRFGIPNAPKNTHLVGQALVSEDYESAFDLLLSSGTREAAKAETWTGDPQSFFKSLDPRICSFYYSAAASFEWNSGLMQAIDEFALSETREVLRDGIRYVFSTDPAAILQVQRAAKNKPMKRYERGGQFEQVGSEQRPATIQTRFRLVDLGADEHHQDYIQASFEFFLPSGTYATMAIDQFITSLKISELHEI